jgi:hypothetical protein
VCEGRRCVLEEIFHKEDGENSEGWGRKDNFNKSLAVLDALFVNFSIES